MSLFFFVTFVLVDDFAEPEFLGASLVNADFFRVNGVFDGVAFGVDDSKRVLY